MSTPPVKSRRRLYVALLLTVVIAGVAAVALAWNRSWISKSAAHPAEFKPAPKPPLAVELVEGKPNTLSVPDQVKKSLSIKEPLVVEYPQGTRKLQLPGSTALDPTRILRIKARFNAEVIEIAQVPESKTRFTPEETTFREIRTGDVVKKGDVLAVLWSLEVGSRKSDLVDALVQLQLDERRLKARTELWKNGSIPEDTLNQTKRDVISDRNAVDRAERGLRVWRVPENEIEAVREEANNILERGGKRDKEKERLWARCNLIAPRDGTIVERNVGVGEFVADNTINIFTIADVDRLLVMANPPEDLLPSLLNLKPDLRYWTLKTVGRDAIEGPIEEISYILDANQHTAVVKGYIPNRDGRMRAGQFVSATINLPAPPDVVEVPLTALAEDGRQSFVFVQQDPRKSEYTMRRVVVSHRFEKTAYVRSKLTSEEQHLKPEEIKQRLHRCQPLEPGTRVVRSGVLELREALEDLESKVKKDR
jgi:cobalt-zinc-cadmium efflux system membrane fusion protein